MDLNLKLKEQLINLDEKHLTFETLSEIQNEFLKNNDVDDLKIEVFKVDSNEFKEILSNLIYDETFSYFLEEIKDFDHSTPYVTLLNGLENVTLEDMRNSLIKELDEIIEDQAKDYDENIR